MNPNGLMNMKSLRVLLVAAISLASTVAGAQQQPPADDELIERVVVRNRLYTPSGKIELSPTVGLTLVNRLTDHYNFNLGVAYNLSDTLGFEVRGGYALSRHTGLARQVSEHLLMRDPTREVRVTDDLTGLWEMKGNGVLGVRWAPLYGKISLLAELPVHFQAYLWAGAGAGMFDRQSIVYCAGGVNRSEGTCENWLRDSKVTWLGSAAFGMRFFTHQGGAIKVEVRDYLFPDSFLEGIDRAVAETGGATGTPATNPGLTNLVLVDLGYTFLF